MTEASLKRAREWVCDEQEGTAKTLTSTDFRNIKSLAKLLDAWAQEARLEEGKWWYSEGETICKAEEVSAAAEYVRNHSGYSDKTHAEAERIALLEQGKVRT